VTVLDQLGGLMKFIKTMLLVCAAMMVGSAARAESPILQQAESRGTLRIAIIASNPPFSIIKADGQPEGYDIDVGTRIAEALKLKPEFTVTDMPGRIVSLQTNKVDITIAGFTKNVERSKVIAFTDPYVVVGMQFLVKADRKDLNTIEDLRKPGVRFGVTRSGTAETNLPIAIGPDAKQVKYNTLSDTLLALKSDQVDAMTQDNLFNGEQMKKEPGAYKIIPGLYSYEEFGIGLPAGDFDFWRIINTWVQQFNASGDNDRLFRKWFGYDQPVKLSR
jgi:polar amino acid transport system substrate-binding protein